MDTMRHQTSYRPLDFIYDPVHITSDKSDYTATASRGLGSVSQYAVQPQFDTMFSDNERYARYAVVLRSTILPNHVDVSWTAKKQRMMADRKPRLQKSGGAGCYFARPNVPNLNPFANIVNVTSTTTQDDHEDDSRNAQDAPKTTHKRTKTPKRVRRAVQTDYRESESQTYPWMPLNPRGLNKMPPEIIKELDFERWQEGFPVTQNELDMIERTRIRRACERALNSMGLDLSNKKNLIKQIEIYEWSQRETEIQRIYILREKLARKQTHLFTYLNQTRMEKRLDEITKRKKEETKRKVEVISRKKERELRKLAAKCGMRPIGDVVDIYNNRTSELYIRSTTRGVNPKFKTRVKMGMTPLQMRRTLRHWGSGDGPLDSEDIDATAQSKPVSLCPQERKWTTQALVDQFEKMKQWRNKISDAHKGKQLEIASLSSASLEESDQLDSAEDKRYLNAVLIQKLIRGRHWQRQVRESMMKSAALIEEVKQTQVLTEEDRCALEDKKEAVAEEQRRVDAEMARIKPLEDEQGQLQGETISSVLDFLSKELARLEDERRAHALSLLAETQREVREAREAGLRQRNAQRRREFDEMFKQVVKIKQDTVDSYLESLLLESAHCLARDKAREFIVEKARLVDLRAESETIGDEALVQDLLYNMAVPELENIRSYSVEEETRRRQTGINDLLSVMYQESLGAEAQSTQDKEKAEDEERRRELQLLQDQLMDMLYPMRRMLEDEGPQMPGDAVSRIMSVAEMEDEIEELGEDVQAIADDIGKDLFEQLLETTHRMYDTVTKQIIEEIIRTLLAKPEALSPSGALDQSDFGADLFGDLDFFKDSTSFTFDLDQTGENQDTRSNQLVESEAREVNVSEISQEFNEEDYN